jgi:hypothetical protein
MIAHNELRDFAALSKYFPKVADLKLRYDNGRCVSCDNLLVGHPDAVQLGDGSMFYLCADCQAGKPAAAPPAAPKPKKEVV